MILIEESLLKAVLEAMEDLHRTGDTQVFDMYAAPELIPALRQALANEALDKMAENARELGLDYEPVWLPTNKDIEDAMRQRRLSRLAEQPAPPPECQTDAEKTAFAFGWWKALESVRQKPAQQEPIGRCMEHGECFGGECIYTSPQPAQQQEPVAYIRKDQLQKAAQSPMLCEVTPEPRQDRIGIYTSLPVSKPWVGLTDEEIIDHFRTNVGTGSLLSFADGVRYAEAKLREKNGL